MSSRIREGTTRGGFAKAGHWKRVRFGSEKGSITILTAFLIPIFLIVVMLSVNVGQLIYEKVRLQNAADMAALSGAAVQAAGLNEIADLNGHFQIEYDNLRRVLYSGTWYDRSQGQRAVDFFEEVFDNIRGHQEDASRYYGDRARDVASRVIRDNRPSDRVWKAKIGSSRPLTGLSKAERKSVRFRYYRRSCSGRYCSSTSTRRWNRYRAGSARYESANGHDGSYNRSARRESSRTHNDQVDLRMRKRRSPTVFEVEVTQNRESYVSGAHIFGYLPQLSARAAAKPGGGEIDGCEPFYRPVLLR